jgi:hypothetical protein
LIEVAIYWSLRAFLSEFMGYLIDWKLPAVSLQFTIKERPLKTGCG